MEMEKNSSHKMMDKKDSIVRKGIIDLQSIDKNKDSKVFQDMMDYNVISDKPGKCPLCGMKLKEVSLKNAKNTLIKSGFKVKE
jgi:Cu(I)/Ag(I) efflux system membrane fusion protein/cobalt-zinc-cadmium efflux system membrane fusion protein